MDCSWIGVAKIIAGAFIVVALIIVLAWLYMVTKMFKH